MEEWKFVMTKEAELDLRRLDAQIRKRIIEKLEWFRDNFHHATPFPLGEPWKGFFKLRVGDWRIIYETEQDKKLVTIHLIGRRDKIYKR